MKQLRQTIAIGTTTAREMIRNPAFFVLLLFGVAATALAPAFSMFHLGEQSKMVADLGLGSVLVVSLLVGVLGASWAIYEELASLSVLALLSKPISRASFLIGKYLGVLMAVFVCVMVLGVALFLTIAATELPILVSVVSLLLLIVLTAIGGLLLKRAGLNTTRALLSAFSLSLAALFVVMSKGSILTSFDRELAGWHVDILSALLGVFLQVAILAAIASAAATRLSFTSNLAIILSIFVLGQLVGDVQAEGFLGFVANVIPDLLVFHFADAVAQNISSNSEVFTLSPSIIAQAILTALAYIMGAMLIGWASLNTRDLQ